MTLLRYSFLILCMFFSMPAMAQIEIAANITPPPQDLLQVQKNPEQRPKKLVKIRILPEYGKIEAGQKMLIGIEQSIYPGWHTYWRNPGDSGTPPRLDWKLPEGFEIGKIQWPTAKKIPYGPLMNYGYENTVTFLQELKAPDPLPDGPLILSAQIEILVCQDECIPEYGTYGIVLNGSQSQQENNSEYLTKAASNLPAFIKPWTGRVTQTDKHTILTIDTKNTVISDVSFLPIDWGIIDNADEPEILQNETGPLIIKQARGERDISEIEALHGVLKYTNATGEKHSMSLIAKIALQPDSAPIETPDVIPSTKAVAPITVISALAFAFLGGLILNLMPCVFPVLSIKALSLIKMSEKHPEKARLHGLAYTGGVVLSFLAIAGLLIGLRNGGQQIGWGFQLQDPLVVSLLAYLLFIIGLNLAGFFDIGGGRFGNLGHKLTQGDNTSNSFFTGVLATLVATPCTAPFMAGAIGFALTQTTLLSLSVFGMLGFGLALPYLALSFAPPLQKCLPKPGPWMENFRQLLAFPMFATCAWLVWVISMQAGPMGVLGLLMGLVAIAFAIWMLKFKPKSTYWKIKLIILSLLLLALALGFLPSERTAGNSNQIVSFANIEAFEKPYSANTLASLLEKNDPIFVEMTAAWCITCKLNHAVALNINSTQALFQEHGIHYLVGDWTNKNPEITKYLNSHGRNGVPLYVYYGPRDTQTGQRPEPKTLPQILTPGIVQKTIKDF